MKIEHIGFLVPEPVSMRTWHNRHIGLEIIRMAGTDEDGVVFLRDTDSNTTIEFGRMQGYRPLDFNAFDPLQVHLAVECENPAELASVSQKAGATIVGESARNDYTNEKILVRDPWGFVLQLINRKRKL
jgi:hypothetical protein